MIFGRFWGQKIAIFQFLTLFQKITDFFENFDFFFKKEKKTSHNLNFKDSHFFRGVFFTEFPGNWNPGNRNPGGDRDPGFRNLE